MRCVWYTPLFLPRAFNISTFSTHILPENVNVVFFKTIQKGEKRPH